MKFNPAFLMGNSPMGRLIGMVQQGGDPRAFIQQAIDQSPQRDQIKQVIGGKDASQIYQTAQNMCRERGTSIEEVLKQFGLTK